MFFSHIASVHIHRWDRPPSLDFAIFLFPKKEVFVESFLDRSSNIGPSSFAPERNVPSHAKVENKISHVHMSINSRRAFVPQIYWHSVFVPLYHYVNGRIKRPESFVWWWWEMAVREMRQQPTQSFPVVSSFISPPSLSRHWEKDISLPSHDQESTSLR